MKRLILALGLLALPAVQGHATWKGALDLDPSVQPIMIRELHDGQWLAGVTKENLWHLDYQGATDSMWNGQRFHAGFFQAWNAEHGNGSFGLVAGLDLPVGLGGAVAKLLSAFGNGDWKPLQYFDSALSLDGIGGYRPVHTSDVDGNWVYGVGARLKIAFGVQELKKGL